MTNLAPTSTDNPFRRCVATLNAMIATAKAVQPVCKVIDFGGMRNSGLLDRGTSGSTPCRSIASTWTSPTPATAATTGSTSSRAMGVIPGVAISKERFFGLLKSLTAIRQ